MKNIVLVLIMGLSIAIYAQTDIASNYHTFDSLRTKAKGYLESKKYEDALSLYQKAFRFNQYYNVWDVVDYAKASYKAGSLDLTLELVKKAINNGCPLKYIKPKLRGFFWTSVYRKNKTSLKRLEISFNKALNKGYIYSLDSLFRIDQFVRGVKLGRFKLPKHTIDSIKSMEPYKVDESNFQCLLKLIEQYGFPSFKNVGVDIHNAVHTIILHNARLSKNSHFLPYLKERVMLGEYLEYNYEFIIWEKEHFGS